MSSYDPSRSLQRRSTPISRQSILMGTEFLLSWLRDTAWDAPIPLRVYGSSLNCPTLPADRPLREVVDGASGTWVLATHVGNPG